VVICLERGADRFAYRPVDATAIPEPRHLLPHLNPDGFYFLVPAYPGCPGIEAIKRVCGVVTSCVGAGTPTCKWLCWLGWFLESESLWNCKTAGCCPSF